MARRHPPEDLSRSSPYSLSMPDKVLSQRPGFQHSIGAATRLVRSAGDMEPDAHSYLTAAISTGRRTPRITSRPDAQTGGAFSC